MKILARIAILIFAAASADAATLVQTASGNFVASTSAVATFGSPVTAGNAIIVFRTSFETDESGSTRTFTITDNKGGANGDYANVGTQFVTPNTGCATLWTHQIRGIANSSGGSGTAVTVTSTEAEDGMIVAAEISGLGTSLTVDGSNVTASGISGDGTGVTGTAKTPGAAGIHLAMAANISEPAGRTATPGTGWTEAIDATNGLFGITVIHRAAEASVAQTADVTLSAGTGCWAIVHAVLSDDDGGGGEQSVLPIIMQQH